MEGFEITDASYPPLEESEYDEEMQENIDDHGHRENDNISSQFRIVPNDNTLRPFLTGFASATARMRLLKEAALWCPLVWGPEYEGGSDSDDGDDRAENEWLSRKHTRLQITGLGNILPSIGGEGLQASRQASIPGPATLVESVQVAPRSRAPWSLSANRKPATESWTERALD
jgi:hypothetical protein